MYKFYNVLVFEPMQFPVFEINVPPLFWVPCNNSGISLVKHRTNVLDTATNVTLKNKNQTT